MKLIKMELGENNSTTIKKPKWFNLVLAQSENFACYREPREKKEKEGNVMSKWPREKKKKKEM